MIPTGRAAVPPASDQEPDRLGDQPRRADPAATPREPHWIGKHQQPLSSPSGAGVSLTRCLATTAAQAGLHLVFSTGELFDPYYTGSFAQQT